MKTIDLHGYTEDEAENQLIFALFEFDQSDESELEIVTGKGEVLAKFVPYFLEQEGYDYEYRNNNSGAVIVFKKNTYF